MSWKAHNWAKGWTGELTSAEAFVLLIIADYFNDQKHRSWPAVETLMQETRLRRSTVFAALKRLETLGLVEVENWRSASGRQRTNRYCLPFYDELSTASRGSSQGARQSPRPPRAESESRTDGVQEVDPVSPSRGPGGGPPPGRMGPGGGPIEKEPLRTTTSEPLLEPLRKSA